MRRNKTVNSSAITVYKMNDAHNGWFMAGAQTMNKVFDNNRRLISQSGCQYYKYYDNEEFSFVLIPRKTSIAR